MARIDRPTCDSCWFAKEIPGAPLLQCNLEPRVVEKAPDDFCRHHQQWPEFMAIQEGEAISEFHAILNDEDE